MQEYNLDKSITPENTTAESMDNIIKAGEDLLKQTGHRYKFFYSTRKTK
jgi:hypothetical protein